jgi:hypothetical protein
LRFLCLFAAFTIKCGFMLGGNSVSFDSWLQAESSAYPKKNRRHAGCRRGDDQ